MDFMTIFFLIIGFVLLIKGADYLVDGASAVAKRFGIPDIIIGLTVVSMGTSAPELVVSVGSAMKGSTGLVFANVIGSNISNTCLILGVAGLIVPLVVQSTTVKYELPLSILIIPLLFILSNDAMLWGAETSTLSRIDGFILLGLFAGFLYYVFRSAKNNPDEVEQIDPLPAWKSAIFIVGGIAGLIVGGDWVVSSAKEIATTFGMTERLVGLTVVAVGTSLPELATSVVAAMKRNSDIAIGNVVGSNIFNVLLVLGTSAAIMPTNYELAINFDLYFLMAVSFVLFAFFFVGTLRKESLYTLDRWEAALLLVAIISYFTYIIVNDPGVAALG